MSATAIAPITNVTRHTAYQDLPELVKVPEAAAYLGCKPSTIYEGVKAGRIPTWKAGSKVILIPKEFFRVQA